MGKPTGFIEYGRQDSSYKPVADRISHYNEFLVELTETEVTQQAARCMDCGIPYCHSGCPVNNIIPDWNDMVYKEDWKAASEVLHSTNNFPEFTGRVCPAPCEASCTLNIDDSPVSIKTIERSIVERAWQEGWIQPQIAPHKSGRRVAIVGSGPAGLACAQQLARTGHSVQVFEKQNRIGGLLRYGIPDFKLNKRIIDRRMAQMNAEGVSFHANTHVGEDFPARKLVEEFNAVVLTGGSEQPRDLPIPGRELEGVYFAMDFLRSNSHVIQGDPVGDKDFISAHGKHVVVIGGGDTGSDCIGTSTRHGAMSVTQVEILPQPPEKEDKALIWPDWPNKMRTSSSQEEGCKRMWSVATKEFISDDLGSVKAVKCIKVEWDKDDNGDWQMNELKGSEFELKADLVTLAMGFVHPVHEGMISELKVELDVSGNVKGETDGINAYKTSITGIFSAGDMRRGQSLIVWAIREGRQCARAVDKFLTGSTELPRL